MKNKIVKILLIVMLLSPGIFAQVTASGISLAGILDSSVPTATITAPNGGEIFQIGDSTNVTWTATDSSFGSTPMGLYYSSDSGATFNLVENNVANSGTYRWEIPNDPSLTVLFKITAIDSFGLGSADTSDAVFKIDGPPAEPTNLAASTEDHKINLSWDSSSEADVANYFVYRSTSASVSVILSNRIDTVSVPNTSYADSVVSHDSTYYYVITAVDSLNNESIASNEVSATAYILQITSVTFQQSTDGLKMVTINYTFTGNPAGTYTITPYYSEDNGNTWTQCNVANISGNFGESISPGAKAITWDFGTALPNTYTSQARIKIGAVEESAGK